MLLYAHTLEKTIQSYKNLFRCMNKSFCVRTAPCAASLRSRSFSWVHYPGTYGGIRQHRSYHIKINTSTKIDDALSKIQRDGRTFTHLL